MCGFLLKCRPVIGRKAHHKKGSSAADTKREGTRMEAEEVKDKSQNTSGGDNLTNNNCNDNSWVPHQRTGIYYPKGQEKIMQDVPPEAAKDMPVNWFSH